MKIKVKYYCSKGTGIKKTFSHSYIFEYEKCDYYCINCGKQLVYEEDGEGDYYIGVNYICANCGLCFNVPLERTIEDVKKDDPDDSQLQIFEAIKKEKTL